MRIHGLAAMSVFLFCLGFSAVRAEERRTLTILHTNDLQGNMLPQYYSAEEELGGWARLYSLLRTLSSEQESVLVVDGGDALGPATLSTYDSGRLVATLMEQAGYDAMVPGNHEFGYGLDTLKVRVREATFPFLGANLRDQASGEPLFGTHIVVERAGIRIGIVGLLSPDLVKLINPIRNPGMEIGHPASALRQALDDMEEEIDLCLVLTHMSEAEVEQLVAEFPEVSVYVVGGFIRPPNRMALRRLSVYTGGARVVTTPGEGFFLGRIDLDLVRDGHGWSIEDCRADLVPVDSRVPEDPQVAASIRHLQEIYQQFSEEQIAYATDPVDDTPNWIAALMRARLQQEVAVINLGTLRESTLHGPVTRGDIDHLIRFDDQVVPMQVTGAQLRRMAASSRARERHGQRLVFSGYDPETATVNQRPLEDDEIYQVATTGFLASGGDGYFSEQDLPDFEHIMLTGILMKHLQTYPRLERYDGLDWRPGGVWKSATDINGSLSQIGLNTHAQDYRGVSLLSGSDALAWNSRVDHRISHERASGVFLSRFRSNFGQLRRDGKFSKAADRLQLDGLYTIRKKYEPFVSINLNTVWTYPDADRRPITVRGSSGTHIRPRSDWSMRVGLGAERDIVRKNNDIGLEIVSQFRRTFARNNSFSSTVELFAGATEGHKISLQHYNRISIGLMNDLAIMLDANYFLHRDSQMAVIGLKSELQLGLGYSWNRKWF